MTHLHSQIAFFSEDAEILIDTDRGQDSVGKKRQRLLKCATGDFVVFIDDDDEISQDYLSSIIQAINTNPTADCIGIKGWITTDGKDRKNWVISKECQSWHEKDSIYYRTPNHISPVRRLIALKAGFPDKAFGEDYDYSMGILPFLKQEIMIDKELYHYKFKTKK